MAPANVTSRRGTAPQSISPALWRNRELDTISSLLAKARALTCMLSGQFELQEEDRREFRHYANVLELIRRMLAEAAERSRAGVASVEANQLVDHADSLCEMMYGDEVVESEMTGNHLDDDLTSWALIALAEQIEAAKDAVDADGRLTAIPVAA